MIRFSDKTLFFDIESHSFDERYSMTPKEYFRLGGFSWGESDDVTITESYDEMLAEIRKADRVVAHNGHSFDLSVLFGVESIEPLQMTRARKVFDSYIHAILANPAPEGKYTDRNGKAVRCTKPEEYRRWYSLDNQAYQLGVPGKLADLRGLAERYEFEDVPILNAEGDPVRFKSGKHKGEAKTTRVRRAGVCCGFGHIPLDLPEFREYLKQDVRALRDVSRKLLARSPFDYYAQREQLKMAINAQISRNGFRVDRPAMTQRIVDMAEQAAYALNDLNRRFGFPLTGKAPMRSTEGKAAVLAALKSVGLREANLGRTPTGDYSFSGDSIKKAAGYQEIGGRLVRPEDGNEPLLLLAELFAMLGGQRSLAELTENSLHPDGKVHPSIQPLQRSGRMSTTEPGLTIWDDYHKDYYIPDTDDEVIVEFDLSQADARAVAAMSGDREFARRFEPGQDGHMINAIAAWGAEKVATDPELYRQKAKAPGHGWGYRLGVKKAAKILGCSLREAAKFLNGLNQAFQDVVRWQDKQSALGQSQGFVVNDWGRKMPITGSTHTQPPALLGQSATNEILYDGLIKLPERILRMIKVGVHDAVVASMPLATLERDRACVVACFERTWKPRQGGQEIFFPLGFGPPGNTWKEAVH